MTDVLLGTNPLLSAWDPTVRWIAAAADDPALRLARAIPEELDFRPWAPLLHSLQTSALPEAQLGASLLLGPEGLEIAAEMTWRSRYTPFVEGKRFIGTGDEPYHAPSQRIVCRRLRRACVASGVPMRLRA